MSLPKESKEVKIEEFKPNVDFEADFIAGLEKLQGECHQFIKTKDE